MHDILQTMSSLGRRLTHAGREARHASSTVAREVIDQLTSAVGSATGEIVRAAVVGAVAAIIRAAPRSGRPASLTDPWDGFDDFEADASEEMLEAPGVADGTGQPTFSGRPCWVAGARAVGTALTVAAGAAAAVPGGRLVAAGLGAVAAVAGLAARAGEAPATECQRE
jgi:hypothetical protein